MQLTFRILRELSTEWTGFNSQVFFVTLPATFLSACCGSYNISATGLRVAWDHYTADSSDWSIKLHRGSIHDGAATPHTPAPASTATHDARSRSVPTQESAFAATTCSMNRIPHNFATVYSFTFPCSFYLFLSSQSSNIRSSLSYVHRIIS
jgi:hypothetical protein